MFELKGQMQSCQTSGWVVGLLSGFVGLLTAIKKLWGMRDMKIIKEIELCIAGVKCDFLSSFIIYCIVQCMHIFTEITKVLTKSLFFSRHLIPLPRV
jgi:hypothetical protein